MIGRRDDINKISHFVYGAAGYSNDHPSCFANPSTHSVKTKAHDMMTFCESRYVHPDDALTYVLGKKNMTCVSESGGQRRFEVLGTPQIGTLNAESAGSKSQYERVTSRRRFWIMPAGSGKTYLSERLDVFVDGDKMFTFPKKERWWEDRDLLVHTDHLNARVLKEWMCGADDGKIFLYSSDLQGEVVPDLIVLIDELVNRYQLSTRRSTHFFGSREWPMIAEYRQYLIQRYFQKIWYITFADELIGRYGKEDRIPTPPAVGCASSLRCNQGS